MADSAFAAVLTGPRQFDYREVAPTGNRRR